MSYLNHNDFNQSLLIQDLDISEIDEVSGGIPPLAIAAIVAGAGVVTGLAVAYFAS